MTAPVSYIPDILDEHIEELQFLLARRPALTRSSIAYHADLSHHDERIVAHLDGVLAVGEPAVAPLAALLSSDEPAGIHAATFALTQLPVPAATDVLTSGYAHASGDKLVAMGEAFVLSRLNIVLELADSRLHDPDALARLVSARVHARHRGVVPRAAWLTELLLDPNPLVRQLSWRFAGETSVTLDAKAYSAALRDENAGVKRAAMIAAARTANPGVLAYIRRSAEKPSTEHADELRLFALLGARLDEKRIRYVATDASLGPLRFELAGLHGAPSFVPLLIDTMRGEDARLAIAAGDAFRRMTGVNVESNERVTLPPEDGSSPDEFESEFLDDGLRPDPEKAVAYWQQQGPAFGPLERICGGRNAGLALDGSAFELLDLETRWWQTIRHQFEQWILPAGFELDAFPTVPRAL